MRRGAHRSVARVHEDADRRGAVARRRSIARWSMRPSCARGRPVQDVRAAFVASAARATMSRRRPTCRSRCARARPSASSASRAPARRTVARCIARLDRTDARPHRDRRRRLRVAVARGAACAAPPRADRVPGPVSFAQSAPNRRRRHRRRPDELRRDAGGGHGARARAPGSRAPRRQRARPLSAPVLGRAAAAHLHRARARHVARPADRRRGRVGARRVGAGAGARAARRDPAAARTSRCCSSRTTCAWRRRCATASR